MFMLINVYAKYNALRRRIHPNRNNGVAKLMNIRYYSIFIDFTVIIHRLCVHFLSSLENLHHFNIIHFICWFFMLRSLLFWG